MSLGHINSIIHEIQKEHGMELSVNAKGHIERLVMSAIQRETDYLEKAKSDWMNKYLNREFPR